MNRFSILSVVIVTVLAMAQRESQAPAAPPVPPALVFAGLVGGANPSAQSITVPNTAGQGSALQVTGSQPWVTVTTTTQGGQTTLTVEVSTQGMSPGISRATIDLSVGQKLLRRMFVWLATVKPLPDDSAYLVEFKYTGYAGDLDGAPNCAVSTNGFDVLKGIVTGREAIPPGQEVHYKGILGRTTVIDYCGTRGRRRPDDDERAWCVAKLTGTASMNVDLEIYAEPGRGAYLKAEPDGSSFTGTVNGDCDAADMREWQSDYPSGDSAASPNGQAIDEYAGPGPKPLLFENGRGRLREGGIYSPERRAGRFGRIDGWEMKVIKKLK